MVTLTELMLVKHSSEICLIREGDRRNGYSDSGVHLAQEIKVTGGRNNTRNINSDRSEASNDETFKGKHCTSMPRKIFSNLTEKIEEKGKLTYSLDPMTSNKPKSSVSTTNCRSLETRIVSSGVSRSTSTSRQREQLLSATHLHLQYLYITNLVS